MINVDGWRAHPSSEVERYGMVKLQKFLASDIDQLISWIPDARFLLQWAGPIYTFPIDRAQLEETMSLSEGTRPEVLMFKAVTDPGERVIGHIQLLKINYDLHTCVVGRVLIGDPGSRGKGFGENMVRLVTEYAFDELGMNDLTLAVFDFNKSAIDCYKRIGFSEYERREHDRRFQNEYWNTIRMRLEKTSYRRPSSM